MPARAVQEILYTNDARIVSQSLQGMKRMITLHGDYEAADSTCPEPPIAFVATVQQYCQNSSFIYLEGVITERSSLSTEIDSRICVGWMSFNRYRQEMYHCPMAYFELNARLVKSEVVSRRLPYLNVVEDIVLPKIAIHYLRTLGITSVSRAEEVTNSKDDSFQCLRS